MRPSTIILSVCTVLSGAATVVFAIDVGPGNEPGFVQVIRLGGIVTVGFAVLVVLGIVNRRRRERLQSEAQAHPGTAFVNTHATESTAHDLEAWSPGLELGFPCDLGFDRSGMTAWSRRDDEKGTPVATRSEITGFDVFDERTPLGSTSRWGIAVLLAPRSAGPGRLRLWVIDEQRNQDEYAMRRTIARIEAALGS